MVMEYSQEERRGPMSRTPYPDRGGDHERLCIPSTAIGLRRRLAANPLASSCSWMYRRHRLTGVHQPQWVAVAGGGRSWTADDYAQISGGKSEPVDCVISSSLFLIL